MSVIAILQQLRTSIWRRILLDVRGTESVFTAESHPPRGVGKARVGKRPGSLVLGRFSHVRHRPLLALAFVRDKLKPERLSRVCNPFQGGHGNLELAIAKSADSDCGDRPKPFNHSKITLWHG
jgi:hypothetical protein